MPRSNRQIANNEPVCRELLSAQGIPDSVVKDIVASGYFVLPVLGQGHMLCDGFYGNKQISGLFSVEALARMITTGERPFTVNIPRFEVDSLADIQRYLANEPRLRHWHANGKLTFRGQSREYFTTRRFPNPVQAGVDGRERLILPSYWRQFENDWESRTDPPNSRFTTILGDELIYRGIPDWKTLSRRNSERYGFHDMSDLEDFPDAESQEYGRRWWLFKVAGGVNADLATVEQHYGSSTHGLDVTFAPEIAAFFATHDFTRGHDGKLRCGRAASASGAVVYAFVFHDPPVRATHDMIQELEAFRHIRPERPRRQRCALRAFGRTEINQAVTELAAIFVLSGEFSALGLPSFSELFPPPGDDPFYAAALSIRDRYSHLEDYPHNWVTEFVHE
jgi:hypothetical protein